MEFRYHYMYVSLVAIPQSVFTMLESDDYILSYTARPSTVFAYGLYFVCIEKLRRNAYTEKHTHGPISLQYI